VASNPRHGRDTKAYNVFNGVPLNESLPGAFWARSVIIDNRTSAYLKIPSAGRWVDPGLGAAFAIPATQVATVEWTAPPGKVQPAPVATEAAQVSFFSDAIPPGFGITSTQPIASGVAGPQQIDRQALTAAASTIRIPAVGVFGNLGSFSSIEIRITARADNNVVSNSLDVQINGDNSASYYNEFLKGFNSSPTSTSTGPLTQGSIGGAEWPALNAVANSFGTALLQINEFGSTNNHQIDWNMGAVPTNNTNNIFVEAGTMFYIVAGAITFLTFFWDVAANFVPGTVITTYGYP
jgi:hypothetical protein